MIGNLRHAKPGTPQSECPLCVHLFYIRSLLDATGEGAFFWPICTPPVQLALTLWLFSRRGEA